MLLPEHAVNKSSSDRINFAVGFIGYQYTLVPNYSPINFVYSGGCVSLRQTDTLTVPFMRNQTRIASGVLLFATLFFLYSFIGKPTVIPALTEAKTEGGMVSGVANGAGDITAFKGVPFAAPPV